MERVFLSVVVASFLLVGCSNGKKDDSDKTKLSSKAVAIQVDNNKNKELKKSVVDINNLAKESKKATEKFTKEMENIAKESDNKMVKDLTSKISEGMKGFQALVPKKSQNGSSKVAGKTGKDIFGVCAGCHGQKANQKALGVSKIIAGWSASKTERALKEFKNGTFSDPMKNIMKGQAVQLSDEDIKKVADYISTLK